MILLTGRELAAQILNQLAITDLTTKKLDIVLVGDNPSSLKYVHLKQQKCQEIGLVCQIHHLPSLTPVNELRALTTQLNLDPEVTGFFYQLPLPSPLPQNEIVSQISSAKDVDGLTSESPYLPAVVRGVLELLVHYGLSVAGKTAVIINDSKLIGLPLQKSLLSQGASVIVCNKDTQNIPQISRGADFLFTATGVPGLVTNEYIKPGAIVFDIGGGDVDYDSVAPLCSYLTPATGSVGPMTIACLLANLVLGPDWKLFNQSPSPLC